MTAAHSLLVRAARGEVVERPPVWAMRQAGRWDPEFNRIRSDTTFYEFSEDVERVSARILAATPTAPMDLSSFTISPRWR